ncbi:hypothetical protein BDZ45DRAFT_799564 [Acephala macrosclerotiorum]|nr:hypothetical protein BDZ45DRAFT_799564 [Acephala macrosclerotiorum]
MGGFAVDIGHLHNKLDKATLTTHGLLFLTDQGHFVELPSDSIKDESKANLFTGKLSDIRYAFWSCIHWCMYFCALIMYAIWARKPYNIQCPTILQNIEPETLAFLVVSSRWRRNSGFQEVDLKDDADPAFCWFGSVKNSPYIEKSSVRTPEVPLRMTDPRIKIHSVRSEDQKVVNLVRSEGVLAQISHLCYSAQPIARTYVPVAGMITTTLCLEIDQALQSGLGAWAMSPSQRDRERDFSEDHGTGTRIYLSKKDFDRLSLAGKFIGKLNESSRASKLEPSTKTADLISADETMIRPFFEVDLN